MSDLVAILVSVGAFAAVMGLCVCAERKNSHNDILEISPKRVAGNILLGQALLISLTLLLTWTADLVSQTPFNWTQPFNSDEFAFNTPRGLSTVLGTVAGWLFYSVALVSLVKSNKEMLDYTATALVLHTIMVGIITGHYPSGFAYWSTVLGSFVLTASFSEQLAYQFETMPFKSHMDGSSSKPKSSKATDTPTSVSPQPSPRPTSPSDIQIVASEITPAAEHSQPEITVQPASPTPPASPPTPEKPANPESPTASSPAVPESPATPAPPVDSSSLSPPVSPVDALPPSPSLPVANVEIPASPAALPDSPDVPAPPASLSLSSIRSGGPNESIVSNTSLSPPAESAPSPPPSVLAIVPATAD